MQMASASSWEGSLPAPGGGGPFSELVRAKLMDTIMQEAQSNIQGILSAHIWTHPVAKGGPTCVPLSSLLHRGQNKSGYGCSLTLSSSFCRDDKWQVGPFQVQEMQSEHLATQAVCLAALTELLLRGPDRTYLCEAHFKHGLASIQRVREAAGSIKKPPATTASGVCLLYTSPSPRDS